MLGKRKARWIELCELADIKGSDRCCLLCRICHEPVSLKSDTVTDENGQSVHEDCYVKEITGHDDPAAEVARILSLPRLA
jgi:hypothetical protein